MISMLDTCGKALEAFVALVIRARWFVLALAVVLAPLGLRYAATNLGINTDTANMITSELPWRESFDTYRDLFAVRDRNIVVVVESADPDVAADAATALAARIRSEPELFPGVFLAGDGEFFARNGLLYLQVDELESLSERLTQAQPLLGQIAGNPNGAGIAEVLSAAVERADDAQSAALLAEIEAAVAGVIESAESGDVEPLDWSGLLQAGTEAAQRQLILVRPTLNFSRMRPARDAIERLRTWIAELQESSATPVTARITGTIAMEHEELDSVVRSASLAGILALIMVIAVLLWALRSLRLLLISLSVLFFGLTGTAVLAAVLVGHLNLLSVAFAVLYVGLGVDFILHICLRVRESLATGDDIDSAIRSAMRSIGASLVVCTLTTAAGFYAFVPSRLFAGISELGLISGTGMFVSFAVSVTLLPALLAIFYRGRYRPVQFRGGVRITAFAMRRARLVVAATLVLVAAAALSLPRVYFDSNPVNLRDPNAESVVTLGELAADSDADLLAMVALFDDRNVAAPWIERFEALDVVSEVRTVAALVPDEQEEKLFLLEDLAFVLGPNFADVEYRQSREGELPEALERLAETLAIRGSDGPRTGRLRALLDELLAQAPAGSAVYDELDRALMGNLSEQLRRLEQALLAEPFTVEDLPGELLQRWIAADGTFLVEIVPSENIRENDAAARFVGAVREVLPAATGLPVVYNEAASAIVISFRQALTYALVAVAIILFIFLGVVRDCIIVLTPIICAAIVTAGATVWFGMPFNFANIIALPLLIGVGVDNAIHMLHRLREPSGAADSAAGSTSLAVLASGLTTIASFGNLAFSSHRGMATMGMLLTIGMFVMMLATLCFLPALLTADRRA